MLLINFKAYLKQLRCLYFWLAIIFILFIGWKHLSDFKASEEHLSMLSVKLIMLCLSFAVLSYACRSFRWLGYMRLTEHIASTRRHIIIYLSGFAFTASPGKLGELMRGAHLNDLGVRFRYTFLSFVTERLLDVIIVLFLGTYFLINHFNSAFSLLSVLMLVLPFIIAIVVRFVLNMSKRQIWLESFGVLNGLWQMTVVLKSQFFTLLAWFAQGFILYLMLHEFGIEISVTLAVSIYCLSLLIGAASLIPSGIGVTEIGMIWLLTQIGVDKDIAIISSLITRMITLGTAMAIGLFCALILKKTKLEPKLLQTYTENTYTGGK